MFEREIRPAKMNNNERSQFIRKAKADRLAFEAAELLSRGETVKAATLAGECRTLAGLEQSSLWLRHYATTRFKVTNMAVEAFLGSMPPVEVAL
jgi:hypothetical protein